MAENPSSARFPTTQWSRVIAAGDVNAPEARAALEELCRDYWFPLYAFARHKGHSPHEAEDLVQGLFADLIERGDLAGLDQCRGRFRSFLRAAFAHYRSNRHDHDRAARRGGGRELVPIDELDAEGRYGREPAHALTPERLFAREWALILLGRVLARLGAETARAGKSQLFEALRPALQGDTLAPSYRAIGAALGLEESAVRVAAHRLRVRYREILREEVARTTGDPVDADEEIAELRAAVAAG
jgi:DNA-directed RNA polymerase specialized sigma24 family protein